MLTGIQIALKVLIKNIQGSSQTEPNNVPRLTSLGAEKRKIAGKNRNVMLTNGKLSKLLKDLVGMVLTTDVLRNAPDRICRNARIIGRHVDNTQR